MTQPCLPTLACDKSFTPPFLPCGRQVGRESRRGPSEHIVAAQHHHPLLLPKHACFPSFDLLPPTAAAPAFTPALSPRPGMRCAALRPYIPSPALPTLPPPHAAAFACASPPLPLRPHSHAACIAPCRRLSPPPWPSPPPPASEPPPWQSCRPCGNSGAGRGEASVGRCKGARLVATAAGRRLSKAAVTGEWAVRVQV